MRRFIRSGRPTRFRTRRGGLKTREFTAGGAGSHCDIISGMLKAPTRKIIAPTLAVALLLFTATGGFSQSREIKILEKALTSALGEKTNFGTKRVVAVREELKPGGKTLIIGVVANNSPTQAGLRHGIFSDVTKILKVLKSWDWPSKVERAMIGEYYAESHEPNMEARPVLMCTISSEKIGKTNWNSFDPRRIPDVVDNLQIDDIIK